MTVKEQLTTDKYEVVSSNPENSEQVDDESRAELLSLIESNSEDII
ncbi:hypothetical protein IJU97_03420 [bacterium]|nr:hypothetical protein [bacterium]